MINLYYAEPQGLFFTLITGGIVVPAGLLDTHATVAIRKHLDDKACVAVGCPTLVGLTVVIYVDDGGQVAGGIDDVFIHDEEIIKEIRFAVDGFFTRMSNTMPDADLFSNN